MSMNTASCITNLEGIPKQRCAGRFFEVQSGTPEEYSVGMRRRCYLRIWKNKYVRRFNSLLLNAWWSDIDLVAAHVTGKSDTLSNLVRWLTQHGCKSRRPYPSPNRAESEINTRQTPKQSLRYMIKWTTEFWYQICGLRYEISNRYHQNLADLTCNGSDDRTKASEFSEELISSLRLNINDRRGNEAEGWDGCCGQVSW